MEEGLQQGRGRGGGVLRRCGRCSFFIFLSSLSLEDAATDIHLWIVVVPSFLFVVATTLMAVGGRGEGGWMSFTSLS